MSDEDARALLFQQNTAARHQHRIANEQRLAGSRDARQRLQDNWGPLILALEEAGAAGGYSQFDGEVTGTGGLPWPISVGGAVVVDEVVREHEVTLSSAQILNLHTTPAVITPAPAAGQFIVPLAVLLTHNHVTTNYVKDVGQAVYIYVSTVQEWNGPNGGFWFRFDRGVFGFGSSTLSPTDYAARGTDDCSIEGIVGQPLALFGGNAPWLGGDGTATVRTAYCLMT